MVEMSEECPICTELYSNLRLPMVGPCNHTICEPCLFKLVKDPTNKGRFNSTMVDCPFCRQTMAREACTVEPEAMHLAFQRDLEVKLEYLDVKYSKCHGCEEMKPLYEEVVCLSCNPELANHFHYDEISSLLNKALCSDCNVYHREYHDQMDTRSFEIPLNILYLDNAEQIFAIAIYCLNEIKLCPIAPVVSVKLIDNLIVNRLKAQINVRDIQPEPEILTFLAYISEESRYAAWLSTDRNFLTPNIKYSIEFHYYFLSCLHKITTSHYKKFVKGDVYIVLNGIIFAAKELNKLSPNFIQGAWSELVSHTVKFLCAAVRAIDTIENTPQLGRFRMEAMTAITEKLFIYYKCPVHEELLDVVIMEKAIVASKMKNLHPNTDEGDKEKVIRQENYLYEINRNLLKLQTEYLSFLDITEQKAKLTTELMAS